MAIHQMGPESAALAMNMTIQQSPMTDDTWIKERHNYEKIILILVLSAMKEIRHIWDICQSLLLLLHNLHLKIFWQSENLNPSRSSFFSELKIETYKSRLFGAQTLNYSATWPLWFKGDAYKVQK